MSTSMSTSSAAPNPFLLAADASPQLLPLLRSDPALARKQDSTGYSLLHALASYRHLELLRTIAQEFYIPLDLRDEDGETALFVVDCVAAAKCLVEELKGGMELVKVKNNDGQTAEEKMRADIEEGDAEDGAEDVAEYLARFRASSDSETKSGVGGENGTMGSNGAMTGTEAGLSHPPPLPKGMRLNVGTMAEDDAPEEIDEEVRARIERLAARDDFDEAEGQQELQGIVKDVIKNMEGDARDFRQRTG